MYLVTKLLLKTVLRLFDLDSVDSSIIEDGIDFDKTDIARNLTLSFTQMIVTVKVNCSVSSNNTSWFQTVRN